MRTNLNYNRFNKVESAFKMLFTYLDKTYKLIYFTMKIPFFEILALIFVLWPLIQRFLSKMKKKQDGEAHSEFDPNYPQPAPDDPGRQEWERAMRELESIFTGEPVQEQQPQPHTRPLETVSAPVTKNQARQVTSLYEDRLRRVKTHDEFQHATHGALSSDAIYKSLDEEVVIHDSSRIGHAIFEDIKDTQRLREFYVMKEVLDKPRSKRPVKSRLLTS
jgi:hypothetical protein